MDGQLSVWVVYDHPRDFPHTFVAREFVGEKPTDNIVVSPDLPLLREVLAIKGLVPLTRHENDDPVIMETWL